MTLYRGPGGTGSATSDADTTLYQDFLNQTIAARDAALQAEINAELAETNAETAETNAETAETNAETAATNAASSASAAASSASSASTSASNASTSASSASTSATAAASSASSASSSASAASTSASNAATSETNAASSASSASTSATNAANSASTATTQATNAASSATAAASSASSASTSATNAANSASSASTSATNAANSATAAAASASEAAGYAASINPADLVHISGTETITGAKTFSQTITGSITGNAGTVTNGVYTTGDQTIGGTKTFSANPVLSAGTANGVAYLNGSKVLTTGSALTFDGTNLGIGNTGPSSYNGAADNLVIGSSGSNGMTIVSGTANAGYIMFADGTTGQQAYEGQITYDHSVNQMWFNVNAAEQMRLTSTGLGIGTSSPSFKLQVIGASQIQANAAGTQQVLQLNNSDTTAGTQAVKLGFSSAGSTKASINAAVYGNDYMTFNVGSDTERMRLDSSGNLGLGVTPSAWNLFKAQEIGRVGNSFAARPDASQVNIGCNWYYASGDKYANTAAATMYEQGSGSHRWYNAPSGTAGNAISFTQAMTLDASGQLGIGNTAPGYRLDITAGDTTAGFGYAARLRSNATAGAATLQFTNNAVSTENGFIRVTDAGLMSFTNRAYITSAGNFGIGTNNPSAALEAVGSATKEAAKFFGDNDVVKVLTAHTLSGQGSKGAILFYHQNNITGAIVANNNGTTSYNTSSDYRLKHDIAPMTGALAKVVALKPCVYKWNVNGSDGQGFIAHELAEVVPQCVTGEKDAVDAEGKPVYQGIDTSFLVATLTAAIQEQQAIIDQLKARLDAANL